MATDTSVKHITSAQAGTPTVGRVAGSLIAMLDAGLVTGCGIVTLSSLVVSGGIATATVASGNNQAKNGVTLIAGASISTLNGEQKVLSASSTTFTFSAAGVPDQIVSGTITAKIAAAGWEKVFAGTNKAVYRSLDPTSTRIYLRVDDSNAEYARVTGYLTMTDIDTGTGAFSSAYFNRANANAGNRAWWLAADSRFVMFGIDTHMTGAGCALCAFGDELARRAGDPYRFMIAGATGPATAWSGTDVAMSSLTCSTTAAGAAYTLARSYTQLGGAVAAITSSAFSAAANDPNFSLNSGYATRIPFPNGGDNAIIVSDAYVIEAASKCLRGRVPGLYVSPQPVGGTLPNGYELINMPDIPGRTLLWKSLGGFNGVIGGAAIDVTGPWA